MMSRIEIRVKPTYPILVIVVQITDSHERSTRTGVT
jgi:hypothetical protein